MALFLNRLASRTSGLLVRQARSHTDAAASKITVPVSIDPPICDSIEHFIVNFISLTIHISMNFTHCDDKLHDVPTTFNSTTSNGSELLAQQPFLLEVSL